MYYKCLLFQIGLYYISPRRRRFSIFAGWWLLLRWRSSWCITCITALKKLLWSWWSTCWSGRRWMNVNKRLFTSNFDLTPHSFTIPFFFWTTCNNIWKKYIFLFLSVHLKIMQCTIINNKPESLIFGTISTWIDKLNLQIELSLYVKANLMEG